MQEKPDKLDFQDYLSKTIEIQKLLTVSKLFLYFALGGFISIIVLPGISPDLYNKLEIILGLITIACVFASCISHAIVESKKSLNSKSKGSVISEALNSLGVNLSSAGKKFQAIDLLSRGELVAMYKGDSYFTEDTLMGEWRGANFRFAECTIAKKTDNGSNTIFNGQVYSIQKDLNVSSPIYVVQKRGIHHIPSMGRVELEDVEFTNMFYVFCDEEVVVRKILTPRYMETIKLLASSLEGKMLTISFTGYGITAMTDVNRDMFEVKVNMNTRLEDISTQFHKDLSLIVAICRAITSF